MAGICPRPGMPVAEASSVACPLWSARERIALQRSIETDGAARAGLGALVWADLNKSYRRPAPLPTRPPLPFDPEPVPIEVSSPVETKAFAKKGDPTHA